MKDIITYNGNLVKLTGKASGFNFEIENHSGETEFVNVYDLYFHGDYIRTIN